MATARVGDAWRNVRFMMTHSRFAFHEASSKATPPPVARTVSAGIARLHRQFTGASAGIPQIGPMIITLLAVTFVIALAVSLLLAAVRYLTRAIVVICDLGDAHDTSRNSLGDRRGGLRDGIQVCAPSW
jgi:chromate transport protein ChrA